MKSFVKMCFNSLGFEIVRKDKHSATTSKLELIHNMDGALRRLSRIGIEPANIIDVGAAAGKWTLSALNYWPTAKYELIEPLIEQTSVLTKLVAQHPNACYHTGVAGAVSGEVSFSVSKDLDGSGVYGDEAGDTRTLPTLTLDSITEDHEGPFLIKLDTHGYEVPILEGACETLKNTEALIVEVYGFYVSPTALLFHQLSKYLEEKGFRLFDIVDVMRRDKDAAFWQADAVYLRANHAIFKDNDYQ